MMTPSDEIDSFLRCNCFKPSQTLRVAVEYSDAMVRELEAALAEWQATATALHALEDQEPAAAAY